MHYRVENINCYWVIYYSKQVLYHYFIGEKLKLFGEMFICSQGSGRIVGYAGSVSALSPFYILPYRGYLLFIF